MGWKLRNGVPSSKTLSDYDSRMASREAEIRRPAIKINVISNEDYAKIVNRHRMMYEWQQNFLKAIAQRNNMIRYKLFLLFKENLDVDTSSIQTVSRQPLAMAIARVCNSITKDSVLYTQLVAFEADKVALPRDDRTVLSFARRMLGIRIDIDDVWSVLIAVKDKKSLLELINSQLKRDLEEINSALELIKELASIPNYDDIADDLQYYLKQGVDWVELRNPEDFPENRFVEEVQGYMRKAKIMSVDQRNIFNGIFNNKSKIRAFYRLSADTEWSKNTEGLLQEKKVLSSIINEKDSDEKTKTIAGTVAETYFECNNLVELSAAIRKEVDGGGDALNKSDEFRKRYETARQEEKSKFQGMENDQVFQRLFPAKYYLEDGFGDREREEEVLFSYMSRRFL